MDFEKFSEQVSELLDAPDENKRERIKFKSSLEFVLLINNYISYIDIRRLLTTASADVLILIPYEAQQGGLCLSPRKTLHVSLTVATPSTPLP